MNLLTTDVSAMLRVSQMSVRRMKSGRLKIGSDGAGRFATETGIEQFVQHHTVSQ